MQILNFPLIVSHSIRGGSTSKDKFFKLSDILGKILNLGNVLAMHSIQDLVLFL
jgi:hypothetical protein